MKNYCHANAMLYFNRLVHMPKDHLAKIVFEELKQLNGASLSNWVTKVLNLGKSYEIDLYMPGENVNSCIRKVVKIIKLKNCHKN